jgi:hypothetical protein
MNVPNLMKTTQIPEIYQRSPKILMQNFKNPIIVHKSLVNHTNVPKLLENPINVFKSVINYTNPCNLSKTRKSIKNDGKLQKTTPKPPQKKIKSIPHE